MGNTKVAEIAALAEWDPQNVLNVDLNNSKHQVRQRMVEEEEGKLGEMVLKRQRK